jgi:hypothetical protein
VFAAATPASEEVAVPEWGEGTVVRVRAFNLAARNAFYAPLYEVNKDDEDARRAAAREIDEARLAAYTVVDEAGELVFGEADIARLRQMTPAGLDRVAVVARRLNGLGVVAQETALKN